MSEIRVNESITYLVLDKVGGEEAERRPIDDDEQE